MARRSRILALPTPVREAIDSAIRDGSTTLDQLVESIRAEFGVDIPRSTLGDYRQRMEERLARLREAREVADSWIKKLGDDPDSKVGSLLVETVGMIAFNTMSGMVARGEDADAGEVMVLSKAMDHLTRAQRTDHEFRARVRAEYRAEVEARAKAAADEARKVARGGGLTDEAADRIRDLVFGVVG